MNQIEYQWKCQPEAEALIEEIVDAAIQKNSELAELAREMQTLTSTRLFDWLDHVEVVSNPELEERLEKTGFVTEEARAHYRVFAHPGAQIPRVVVYDPSEDVCGVAILVESIEEFLRAHRGGGTVIEGSPYSGYRRCCISGEQDVSVWVVERRGSTTMEPTWIDNEEILRYLEAETLWAQRCRDLDDEDEGMRLALICAEEIVDLVGPDKGSWIVMDGERRYWQSRNTAAQIQKNRQDRLGLGWANHDHHTFRSSRRHFAALVRLCEMLGFRCRERFYAGLEAGWGAQVMENRRSRLITFLDVDLSPEEVAFDFAHQKLPERNRLGTIGLWCGLHGDSILRAGMHHLEGQFEFDLLRDDLKKMGVGMMEPFSNFPYLKQAFTLGETWKVPEERLQKLLQLKLISEQEAEKFRSQGGIGSHMENLQRREGFKGFNQKNVSFIIKETDPRKQGVSGAEVGA